MNWIFRVLRNATCRSLLTVLDFKISSLFLSSTLLDDNKYFQLHLLIKSHLIQVRFYFYCILLNLVHSRQVCVLHSWMLTTFFLSEQFVNNFSNLFHVLIARCCFRLYILLIYCTTGLPVPVLIYAFIRSILAKAVLSVCILFYSLS